MDCFICINNKAVEYTACCAIHLCAECIQDITADLDGMCYCERAALDLKKYAKTALDTESIVAELEFQIKKFRDFDASIDKWDFDTMTREVWRKSEEKAITIAKEILDRVVAFPNIQAIPEGMYAFMPPSYGQLVFVDDETVFTNNDFEQLFVVDPHKWDLDAILTNPYMTYELFQRYKNRNHMPWNYRSSICYIQAQLNNPTTTEIIDLNSMSWHFIYKNLDKIKNSRAHIKIFKNKQLTWEIIRDHLRDIENLDWDNLHRLPFMNNPRLAECPHYISWLENYDDGGLSIVDKQIMKICLYYSPRVTPDSLERNYSLSYELLCANKNFSFEYILKNFPRDKISWDLLSARPDALVYLPSTIFQLPWKYDKVSQHIPYDILASMTNSSHNPYIFNWKILSKRADIVEKLFPNTVDTLPWDFDAVSHVIPFDVMPDTDVLNWRILSDRIPAKYATKYQKKLNWTIVCARKNIIEVGVYRLFPERTEWDWDDIARNYATDDDIKIIPASAHKWLKYNTKISIDYLIAYCPDADTLSLHPQLTLNIIDANPKISWKWGLISANKAMTYRIVNKNRSRPWDYHVLS
jgi:hypothetical protein